MGEKSSQILSTVGVKVLSNAVTVHCGTERKLLLLFGLGCGHANPAHLGAGACLKKERGVIPTATPEACYLFILSQFFEGFQCGVTLCGWCCLSLERL